MTLTTRHSLLQEIKDLQNHEAWLDFANTYSPLILGFARKRGLQDADAYELVQESLTAVSKAIEGFEYDPERGKFRSWLFKIASRKLYDLLLKSHGRVSAPGGDENMQVLLSQQDPFDDLGWKWELEEGLLLFNLAAADVRARCEPTTWLAFWRTHVEDRPPEEVAEELEMSVGAVAIAKSRVKYRIQVIAEGLLERRRE